MLKWRVLLVLVLACTTMPDSVQLAAYWCHVGLVNHTGTPDQPARSPDLPAPCDGEEGKWLTSDSVDDHDGSFFWILDLQPVWPPALSAGSRGLFATSRDLIDSLHRLRI